MTLPDDQISNSPVTMDELERRFRQLFEEYPPAIPIVAQVLDHLKSMAPDHLTAASVLAYYKFCRDSPEMAMLLAALCHATQRSPEERIEASEIEDTDATNMSNEPGDMVQDVPRLQTNSD